MKNIERYTNKNEIEKMKKYHFGAVYTFTNERLVKNKVPRQSKKNINVIKDTYTFILYSEVDACYFICKGLNLFLSDQTIYRYFSPNI